jgi:hypothetical protein
MLQADTQMNVIVAFVPISMNAQEVLRMKMNVRRIDNGRVI